MIAGLLGSQRGGQGFESPQLHNGRPRSLTWAFVVGGGASIFGELLLDRSEWCTAGSGR
jgi:hypothetical protein